MNSNVILNSVTQMDWLEKLKKSDASNEAITTEIVGQSHMEQRGLGMFAVADRLDRQGEYGKNIVKVIERTDEKLFLKRQFRLILRRQ